MLQAQERQDFRSFVQPAGTSVANAAPIIIITKMTLQDDPEAFVELLEGCCGITGLAQVTVDHSPLPTIATTPAGSATAPVRKSAEVPRFKDLSTYSVLSRQEPRQH